MARVLRHTAWVRASHWIHALSIVVLILSGIQIHWAAQFRVFGIMSNARFAHFLCAWLLLATFVFRTYYYLMGTPEGREIVFRPSDVPGFFRLIYYYLIGIFLRHPKPHFGIYNPGQKLAYTAWPIFIPPLAVTGFALYYPSSWAWLTDSLGGLGYMRLLHFLLAGFFGGSLLAHIYLGTTGTTVGSFFRGIITGYEQKAGAP